jgi:hypothetical protein
VLTNRESPGRPLQAVERTTRTRPSGRGSVGGQTPRPTDRYFYAWALVIPIASILVIPFVQGTTPSNLFALALLFPPVALLLMSFEGARKFYKTLLWIAACFVAFIVVAQLALAALDLRYISGLELVDPLDKAVVLRTTLFTQSLYLFVGVTTFVFVRWFYRREWDRWLLAGAILLAAYGIYELCFFAIAQRPGDFLSNRTFGAGFHPGSWFQTISVGPIVMQRLKSLTGEPAMYAFTILPFWIYALHTGRNKTQWLLLLSLLLTASTTAVLGIAVYLFVRILWFQQIDRLTLAAAAAFLTVAGLWALDVQVVRDVVDKVLLSKLSLESISGVDRYRSFEDGIRYFLAAPLTIQLVGVGWGYTRGSNMFTTLLINVGAIGFAITIAFFLYPVVKLGNDLRSAGLKAAVLVLLATLMIAVPEYGYPSMWLFLGIAYHEVLKGRVGVPDGKAAPAPQPAAIGVSGRAQQGNRA